MVSINKKIYILEEKEKNYLIYQYLSEKNIELPCLCYNENLEIAGNCRICLVEIKTNEKLILGCSTKIEEKMFIMTETKRLIKTRKAIMEFLLINHPLDCPICDQGGECDLQNLGLKVGLSRGRYYEFIKRTVIDKEAGLFIKTVMTRCIHCTRCIRFFQDVENKKTFGLLSRGEDSEIILNKVNLLSIMSGNVVDICPVGALTDKVYTFKGRP